MKDRCKEETSRKKVYNRWPFVHALISRAFFCVQQRNTWKKIDRYIFDCRISFPWSLLIDVKVICILKVCLMNWFVLCYSWYVMNQFSLIYNDGDNSHCQVNWRASKKSFRRKSSQKCRRTCLPKRGRNSWCERKCTFTGFVIHILDECKQFHCLTQLNRPSHKNQIAWRIRLIRPSVH